jgi:hypothetical protein
MRTLAAVGSTLLATAVLAPAAAPDNGAAPLRATNAARDGPAPLRATKIRIGDHPAFVRVVVDFTGARVEPGEVVATDPDPFPDGFVRLPLMRPGVRTTAAPVNEHGVDARIAQGTGRITIRLSGADRRFKYVGYFAQHSPERLVLDLYKSRPPSDAAEILRGRRGCLTMGDHSVGRRRVTASGRERNLFEHSLAVVLRRNGGRVHRLKAVTAANRRWSTSFRYPRARRQTGTLEAMAQSAKDGTLDCLVQVRVRMGGS